MINIQNICKLKKLQTQIDAKSKQVNKHNETPQQKNKQTKEKKENLT